MALSQRRVARLVRNARGSVLMLVAAGMLFMLGMAGLAIDSGRAYLARLELTRAVDSAALTGARSLRAGRDRALAQARAAARANGVITGIDGAWLQIDVSSNAEGESTFEVAAGKTIPTILMRVLGVDHVDVTASALAAVPPVDLVLVLDQSYSLVYANAWDDLQLAAKKFVDYFDDSLDQMGAVSYHTVAADRFQLSHNFRASIKNRIDAMNTFGYTNTVEGLRMARDQITGPSIRDRSTKVVVFFTDGQPTAYRTVSGTDLVVTIRQTNPASRFNGYYDNPASINIDNIDYRTRVDGCSGTTSCLSMSAPSAWAYARQRGLDVANEIRAAGVLVYSIGLGDPNTDPAYTPDPDYLRQLANVDGMTNPNQPAGRMYFAPTAAELEAVFTQVAADLLTRLAR